MYASSELEYFSHFYKYALNENITGERQNNGIDILGCVIYFQLRQTFLF